MIEQGIRDALAADSTVAGMVSARIRPLIGSQDDVQPRIAYQVTGDENIGTYAGPGSHGTATVEIDCIGDTFKQSLTLSDAVKSVFDHQAITTATIRISFGKLTDETDVEQALIEGTEQPVYLRTLTFEFLYRAAS